MENYIVINGKKAELTDEQLKALGIEVKKKSPFERADTNKDYYYIDCQGHLNLTREGGLSYDNAMYNIANYCTDKSIMKQRALHETLNRLLWRTSVQAGELENEWDGHYSHWHIVYDDKTHRFYTSCHVANHTMNIYFPTEKSAKEAIKNIIEPFIAQHPDFVW